MIIKVRNTLPLESQKTFTSFDEPAAAGTIRWKNPNVFQASWGVQIGETGEERAEIMVLGGTAPAGTAGTFSSTSLYEHPADTPMYAIKWDQIVFKRSTSGTAGTPTALTDGTITIQPDAEFTVFDDTTGTVTDAYKTQFRSSGLSAVSTESDFIVPGGFSFFSLGKLKERVRDKLWNADFIKDDSIIDSWINEWLQDMVQVAVDVNQDYSLGTVDVAFGGADGLGTITNGDFKTLRRVWVTYNGVDYFRATKDESINQIPDQTYNSTNPYFWMRGDSVFQVKPDNSGGSVRIDYYSSGTVLTNDSDELPVYMRGYTKSFVDYAVGQALMKDNKQSESRDMVVIAEAGKERFKRDIVPRNRTGMTTVQIVESIDEEIVF